MLEHRQGTVCNQMTFFSAKLSPRFDSFGSALTGALSMPICDNVCLEFNATFSLTPPRQYLGRMAPASSACAAPPRLVTAVLCRCAKLCACHRVDHPPYHHSRSGWQRSPHSCSAFAVATGHFSPTIPLCSGRRYRRCAHNVCDTMTQAPAYRLPACKNRTQVLHHYRLLRATFRSAGSYSFESRQQ